MMRALRGRTDDDSGMGLVLVMGLISVITTLITISLAIGLNALSGSARHVTFEQALAAAENGVDFALARLQESYTEYGSDYPIPSPPTAVQTTPACNAATVSTGVSSFSTAAAEQTWARTKLLAVAAANPSCVRAGGVGEWIVIKPTDKQSVYAMGFVPTYADYAAGAPGAKARVIKAEYLFAPYRPSNAVLTGSSLTLGSSTTVTAAPGADPTVASVHSNGTVTVATGNPRVTGAVTASVSGSGTSTFFNSTLNPGGAVKIAPLVSVPKISARSLYFQNVAKWSSVWFDLCPDGTVRRGSTSGPCLGSAWVTLPGDGSALFRGWKFFSATKQWMATRNTLDGIYFAHYADIVIDNANATLNNVTLIAESLNPSDCSTKSLGNIDWNLYDLTAPMLPNQFMMADQDIRTGSNFRAGSGGPPVVSGGFTAGDQIEMQTSSNGAYGSVIAGDYCSISGSMVSSNFIKNPSIYFDPNGYMPFTSIISTTLWLEYVG